MQERNALYLLSGQSKHTLNSAKTEAISSPTSFANKEVGSFRADATTQK